MAIVYKHITKGTNQVFYIGIGKTKKRAYNKSKDRSIFWHNIAKRGYNVEVLLENLTWEEACEKEKELISLYGRRDLGLGPLVNMTDGGDGGNGIVESEETREKIRKF